MYQVLCMSFDGDYITETLKFRSIDDAWEYANNLGSKWYFYPFHFVIKNLTIKDTPDQLKYFKNKRIITVCRMFNLASKKGLAENVGIDQFVKVIIDEIELAEAVEVINDCGGKQIIKEYPETHQTGLININQNILNKDQIGNFGIQIAADGRIWICINGESAIRFKPFSEDLVQMYKDNLIKKED